MTITYNRAAIMSYAHNLRKKARGMTMGEALKSAWDNAKYIIAWTLRFEDSYNCGYPVVNVPGKTWAPDDRSDWQRWVDAYGAE